MGWGRMLVNILRISASYIPKTFLNTTGTIECTSVISHSYKPTGNINRLYQLAAALAGKKATYQ